MNETPNNPDGLFEGDGLPETLPQSPMALVREWFLEAVEAKKTRNPDAFALATADKRGVPSVRILLCKHLDELGYLVFYTNLQSRKGRELSEQPRAAAVFHLDAFERQIRVEGHVVQSPDAESDEYFAGRSVISRIGAWASDQSRPIASREHLMDRVADTMDQLGVGAPDILGETGITIPRPPYWGGYRLWFDAVELWVGGTGRVHDRVLWTRELRAGDGQFDPGPWEATRLQP